MLLARMYRTLEFEELKPFPRNGLIIYAVRIVDTLVLIWINKLACQHSQNRHNRSLHTCKQQNTRAQQLLNMSRKREVAAFLDDGSLRWKFFFCLVLGKKYREEVEISAYVYVVEQPTVLDRIVTVGNRVQCVKSFSCYCCCYA